MNTSVLQTANIQYLFHWLLNATWIDSKRITKRHQGRWNYQNFGVADFKFIVFSKFSVQSFYSGNAFWRRLTIEDTHFTNKVKLTMVIFFENKPHYSGNLSIEDAISENQWCPLLRGSTVYPYTRGYVNGKYWVGGPRNSDFRYMLQCIWKFLRNNISTFFAFIDENSSIFLFCKWNTPPYQQTRPIHPKNDPFECHVYFFDNLDFNTTSVVSPSLRN